MELGANLASFGSVQSAELSGTEGESVHGSGGSLAGAGWWAHLLCRPQETCPRQLKFLTEPQEDVLALRACCFKTVACKQA